MKASERVLKAINHEEPDRVPSFEIITNNSILKHYDISVGKGYRDGLKQLSKLGDKGNELIVKGYSNYDFVKRVLEQSHEFYRRAEIDIALTLASIYPRKILTEGDGIIDEYGRIMKQIVYKSKDGTETVVNEYFGGYFKDFDDYESWEQPDPYWEARLINFRAGKEIQEEKNNEIFSVPSLGAMMECSWEGFGLENFSRILTKPKQARKIFDDRGKFTLELVKILAENDAQLVLLWDDYGYKMGLFMSPRNYQNYVFPWLKRICNAAHKRNCKVILHSDGDLSEIFEDIIYCGVDALNPIEPTTANPDYDIFKLKKKYGDQITFIGNLSPILLFNGEKTEIEAYAKRLIRNIAPGGGFIFSSGHSINPAVTVDRFESMQNIRRKYGNYPINIPV
ncbi:MAG: Uroporphyrinogen decarboxylase [Candidatus Lokiarchaeum sp. GC14_75]|nr:MAG: Uroporphyrinogen decarboxylase [Candidatus Lokiarchaeum sp. GC14_75]